MPAQREAAMRRFAVFVVLAFATAAPAAADDIAPGASLRAVYLAGNPAQAVQDRQTGAIRGASADIARELGKRLGKPVELKPLPNPQSVIDAVAGGTADIGFVAFAPSRMGTVEFSQTYMFVQQSFLVLEASRMRAIADVDRAGQKIAGGHNDSVTLYMKRKFKQATVIEIESDPGEIKRRLLAREIDAFAANRQRLTTLMKDAPGTRLLPGSLFGVPQTIIVPKGKTAALAAINRTIDELRTSGFLESAVKASGIVGIEVAPGGSWTPSVPE
jgi:polar amino acid transport system substrate-binding protein